MDTSSVSPFCHRVYETLKMVPSGYLTTYKDLAGAIGCNSPRAVGQALRSNPFAPTVPCHRVVSSNGTIGGFCGEVTGKSIQEKIRLLTREGIVISDGKIMDFSARRFVFPKPRPSSV